MATTDSTPTQLKLPFDGIIEIFLTRGHSMTVSIADADLNQFKWHVAPDKRTYYALRTVPLNGRRTSQSAHRVIMSRVLDRDLEKHEQVDHINGNGLDNRRENLRLAASCQNTRNSRLRVDNSSGYKGVSWKKESSKWVARIMKDKKMVHLGYFDDPTEAYAAYCAAAFELHGEFARVA